MVVEKAAAAKLRPIATERHVGHGHQTARLFVIEAAAGIGRVAAEGDIHQRRLAAAVVYAAATAGR